jgi:hypothetical protein
MATLNGFIKASLPNHIHCLVILELNSITGIHVDFLRVRIN